MTSYFLLIPNYIPCKKTDLRNPAIASSWYAANCVFFENDHANWPYVIFFFGDVIAGFIGENIDMLVKQIILGKKI